MPHAAFVWIARSGSERRYWQIKLSCLSQLGLVWAFAEKAIIPLGFPHCPASKQGPGALFSQKCLEVIGMSSSHSAAVFPWEIHHREQQLPAQAQAAAHCRFIAVSPCAKHCCIPKMHGDAAGRGWPPKHEFAAVVSCVATTTLVRLGFPGAAGPPLGDGFAVA